MLISYLNLVMDDAFIERVIAKENYAEDDVAKSFILDIYNLVQNKIPDIIKNNIEIKTFHQPLFKIYIKEIKNETIIQY